jgi:hypothetical protein
MTTEQTFSEKMNAAKAFVGERSALTGTEYYCFCQREKMKQAGWETSELKRIGGDWFVFWFIPQN